MSGSAGSPGADPRPRAVLLRWAAAVSLVAGALTVAVAGLPEGDLRELGAAAAAVLAVALIQVVAVRVASGGDAGAIRTGAVLPAWGAVAVLVGPPLLVVGFAAGGQDPGAGLARYVAAHLAAQGVFGLALHRVVRGLPGPHEARPGPGGSRRPAWLHRVPGLLLVLLLPAAGLAAGLGWSGERAARSATLSAAAAGYQRLCAAALGTPPLPQAGGIEGLIAALTPFDEAAPFAIEPSGIIVGHLGSERRAQVVELAGRERDGTLIDPATGRGFVWTTLAGSGVVAGLRLAVPADPGFAGVIAALVLAAALLGALVAAWISSRLRARLSARVAAIEALPDRGLPPLPPGPIRELEALDRAIRGSPGRLAGQRPGGEGAGSEARDSRERKAQVFAGMSHDLRSPLNSVVGFTDLLLKGMDGALTPAQRGSVARIGEEAERLLVQIGDILDTARLDAGRFTIERAWVPSVEILTECAAGAQRLVASKDVTFRSRLQPGLPPVRVDKSRIVQALLSLVARALEATDRGEILLDARRQPGPAGGLSVEIADPDGSVGFARRALIDEAWKLSETGLSHLGTTRPVPPELGPAALGLSLARRMVALHGGTVTAGTGHGDRVLFSLTLPLDSDRDEG